MNPDDDLLLSEIKSFETDSDSEIIQFESK
jgi:hypothetical protein